MKQEPKTLKKIVDFLIPLKKVHNDGGTYVSLKQNYNILFLTVTAALLTTYIVNSADTKDWSIRNYLNSAKNFGEIICTDFENNIKEIKETYKQQN
jgi:hypothetical protein